MLPFHTHKYCRWLYLSCRSNIHKFGLSNWACLKRPYTSTNARNEGSVLMSSFTSYNTLYPSSNSTKRNRDSIFTKRGTLKSIASLQSRNFFYFSTFPFPLKSLKSYFWFIHILFLLVIYYCYVLPYLHAANRTIASGVLSPCEAVLLSADKSCTLLQRDGHYL